MASFKDVTEPAKGECPGCGKRPTEASVLLRLVDRSPTTRKAGREKQVASASRSFCEEHGVEAWRAVEEALDAAIERQRMKR